MAGWLNGWLALTGSGWDSKSDVMGGTHLAHHVPVHPEERDSSAKQAAVEYKATGIVHEAGLVPSGIF